MHIQTSQEARRVVDESSNWTIRLKQSWYGISEVTKAWSKYEYRFQKALHNLSERIWKRLRNEKVGWWYKKKGDNNKLM